MVFLNDVNYKTCAITKYRANYKSVKDKCLNTCVVRLICFCFPGLTKLTGSICDKWLTNQEISQFKLWLSDTLPLSTMQLNTDIYSSIS